MGFKDFLKKFQEDNPQKDYILEIPNKVEAKRPINEEAQPIFSDAQGKELPPSKRRVYPKGHPEADKQSPIFTDKDGLNLKNNAQAKKPFDYDEWAAQRKITIPPKPVYENRPVIILALENTVKVLEYRNEIMKLINKIISDNKNALFMFLEAGNQKRFFNILKAEDLTTQSIPDCLLARDNVAQRSVNLADTLAYVQSFVEECKKSFNLIECSNGKFNVSAIRILFIGTGCMDDNPLNVDEASKLLKLLCESKSVKNIKYFCIKDENAIDVSSIGFPIIGHIESSFYK